MKKSISFKLLTLLSINCLNLLLLNSLLEEGCQNPYFMKTSPPILPTPFLKFRPSLLPPSPNLHAHCSFDRRQVYWGLKHVIFYQYSDLISNKHRQRHTAHTGANTLTHQYRYILTSPAIYINTMLYILTHVIFTNTLIWNLTHTHTHTHTQRLSDWHTNINIY